MHEGDWFPGPKKEKAPAWEGGRYKSSSNPRGPGEPGPYKAERDLRAQSGVTVPLCVAAAAEVED
jgi:hypothetical protein